MDGINKTKGNTISTHPDIKFKIMEVKVKRILFLLATVALVLGLLLAPSVGSAADQVAKAEVILAQEAGQAWLDRTAELTGEPAEWSGAHLTTPQPYYDLNGQINAYMFAIENDGVVGHIIVGSSAYGYPVFEAGEAAPPSIPGTNAVKSIVKRDLAFEDKSIAEPTRLLYLGFDHLYALYDVEQHMTGVNLIFKYAVSASDLKAQMPSPEAYKANKKVTSEAKPSLLGSRGYKSLTMEKYCGSGRCCCGPASGVSIGLYYRNEHEPEYDDLPYYDWNMYDWLYQTMLTGHTIPGSTLPQNYGPGFVEMTEEFGYDNFRYYNDSNVTGSDYWRRVSDINHGWPIGLLACNLNYPGHPPAWQWHWLAIRGYQYPRGDMDYAIQCTDNYTGQSSLWLDWGNIGWGLFTCTIKD